MSASAKSPKAQLNPDFFSRCDVRIPIALAVGFLLVVAYVIHALFGEL